MFIGETKIHMNTETILMIVEKYINEKMYSTDKQTVRAINQHDDGSFFIVELEEKLPEAKA